MHVIVIGAGPVGAATAYGLKTRCGLDVTVYDGMDAEAVLQQAARADGGGGGGGGGIGAAFGGALGGAVSLHANGRRALAALGLEAAVARAPHTRVRGGLAVRRMDGGGAVAHYAAPTATDEAKNHWLYLRADLHVPILRACVEAGVAVVVGRRLVRAAQEETGVTAHFADGTWAKCDILIGADGMHSATRASVFGRAAHPTPWAVGYVGVFARTPPHAAGFADDLALFADARRGSMAYCANCSPSRGAWFVMEPPPPQPAAAVEALCARIDAWRPYSRLPMEAERLAAVVRAWGAPPRVAECVRAAFHISPVAMYDLPNLPSFHCGRVLLVGDAAHGTVPMLGQGLCTGLEDAAALTDLFAQFPPQDYETVFALFDKARKDRVAAICANSRGAAARIAPKNNTNPFLHNVMLRTTFSLMRFFGAGDNIINYDYKADVDRVVEEYKAKKEYRAKTAGANKKK